MEKMLLFCGITLILGMTLVKTHTHAGIPIKKTETKGSTMHPELEEHNQQQDSGVMDNIAMEMATLGRPLYPGMLYDSCRDMVVPGVTLWDKKILLEDLIVHHQPKTDLKFAASDTVSDKAELLDVSAELKASFLGGLVNVGGSGMYLNDKKSSTNQCRVTMHYSQTTKFQQITMAAFGKITYPQVFDQHTATHVITAALYGAQAFMVFDYMHSENENKQEVEGNLNVMMKKIPSLSIEGKGSVKMNEREKNLASNISVTFHGDYELVENPTTYMEAVEIYKKLPTILKSKGSDGVPMKVWLYPLKLLNDKAAQLMREISISLVSKTEHLLEELAEEERRCNDLFKNQWLDNFPDLKVKLQMFMDFQNQYKITFQQKLSTVLPAIRSGKQDEKALADILENHNKSPFVAVNLNKWLDNITTEINMLRSITSGLPEVNIVTSSGALNLLLIDPDIDVVVCLAFTSLSNTDPYLYELKDFLNSDMFANSGEIETKLYSIQTTEPLITTAEIYERMRQNLFLFKNFQKVNISKKKIRFVIASISDPTNPGTSIRLYKKGRLTDPKFQPVSKPPPPEVEPMDKGVKLKLQKSPTGKTVRFRVEYRTTKPTDSGPDDEGWKVTDTPDAQSNFQLTGLPPSPKYWVRYRAVSDVGVSEPSDSVTFSLQVKTSVISNWTSSSVLKEVRTKIMNNWSISRWKLSTIQSEITNVVNNPAIPYEGDIPGGLKPGTGLYFQGTALADAQRFDFNLKIGPQSDDIAFHFNPRINDSVVRNSYRNDKWGTEELTQGCPITRGSAFDIFFAIKTEGYEVYVNGQRYCLFKHRMPVEKVTVLNICGNVLMNTIGIVPNWSTSTFGKELSPGVSRDKNSNIQADVAKPVCSPSSPYTHLFPGGLRPGQAFYFQGVVVSSDFKRLSIDLESGSDIAFHFLGQPDSVVRNTYKNGNWETKEETRGSPFVKGGAFDIIMSVKTDCYEVFVNGLQYCTYNHRIPVNQVSSMTIYGDVFMNTFGIIEVTVKIPANI